MNKIGSPKWFHEKAQEKDKVKLNEEMEKLRVDFYERFAPNKLAEMSGEELLVNVFGDRSDSMMQWLIFNPHYRNFGAAGKYKYLSIVYKQQGYGWKYRDKSGHSLFISKVEASSKAEKVRDDLLRCVNFIQNNEFDTIKDYEILEDKLKTVYFYDYPWAIKYYQMFFPYLFPGMYADVTLKRALGLLGLPYHGVTRRILNAGEISLFIRRCDINNIVFGEVYSEQWGWEGEYPPCEAAKDNFEEIYNIVCKNNYTYYNLGKSNKLKVEDYFEKAIEIDQEIDSKNLTGSEREAVVKTRVNQGVFRELLLRRYKKCCLCGVSYSKILVASHIKPWSESNANEKLDINNGFILCPNHDKLFNDGWISFDDDGKIIISEHIDAVNRIYMNVNPDMQIMLTEGNKDYLRYHREKVLQK